MNLDQARVKSEVVNSRKNTFFQCFRIDRLVSRVQLVEVLWVFNYFEMGYNLKFLLL